jgi:hypothetical protein
MNINHLNTAESSPIVDALETFNLHQVVRNITHKQSLIDVAYLSDTLAPGHMCKLRDGIENHHQMIEVTVEVARPTPKREQRQVWGYRKANWDTFCMVLNSLNLMAEVYEGDNINRIWTKVKNGIISTAQMAIPRRTVKIDYNVKWCNNAVKNVLRSKRKAHSKYKRTGLREDYNVYSKLRKKSKKMICAAKRSYYYELFGFVCNIGQFWANYRKCFSPKPYLSSIVSGTGIVFNEECAMAECLSDHFASVWNSRDIDLTVYGLLDEIPDEWFCDVSFVSECISKLDCRKAVGFDGVSAQMLQSGTDVLSPIISALINKCIKLGGIPDDWKVAFVSPIPKVHNSNKVKDFRPISVLSTVDKLYELHLLKLLKLYISTDVCEEQFGFMKGRSTTDALLYFDYLIATGFKYANSVGAVYFDCSKAFDSVPFNLLIQVLRDSFDLPDHLCALLIDYLSDRYQIVRVGGSCSEKVLVTSGVPQGSVLGPYLFIAFINRIAKLQLSTNCMIVLFADDIVIVRPIASVECAVALQSDVWLVDEFLKSLFLTLNSTKTKFQQFLRPRAREPIVVSLELNDLKIDQIDSHKYLGVTFNSVFDYSGHANSVAIKCKQSIGALSRQFRKCVSVKVLSYLYSVLIRSVLMYSIEAYYPPGVEGRLRLEKCQFFAARCITRIWDQGYLYLLGKLNWLPIYRHVFIKRLTLIHNYRMSVRHFPSGCLVPSTARRSNRLSNVFEIEKYKHDRIASCALLSSIVAYNALPRNIIDLSPKNFKISIKTDELYSVLMKSLKINRHCFVSECIPSL